MPAAVTGILTMMFGASRRSARPAGRSPPRRGRTADRSAPTAGRSFPLCASKIGFSSSAAFDRHLLDQPPGDVVLGRRRHRRDQLEDALPPEVHLLLQHLDDDHGIAGGADRAVLDRVGQLLQRARVVPQTGRRRLRHLVQRALGTEPRSRSLSLRGRRRGSLALFSIICNIAEHQAQMTGTRRRVIVTGRPRPETREPSKIGKTTWSGCGA